MAFEARNPALRLLALLELIEGAHNGRLDELVRSGTRPEVLDLLLGRALGEAAILSARESLRVMIDVDNDSVVHTIQGLDRESASEKLKEYFIRHAATLALIQKLFKLDRAALDKLRKLLCDSPRGRPPLPPAKERDAIQKAWSELIRSEADTRMRYYRLHERFPQHPIRMLEAVLKEFEE